jgi:hypothetical protein
MLLRITRGVSGTEGIEPERHRESYRYGALDAEMQCRRASPDSRPGRWGASETEARVQLS